ncbi:rCG51392 [Rattus norvegicus]|uniref:RCG51392 n=1 Tax=Rattus norvegicus TaxID=10116 RepID=A6IYK1_RAT|nr:rCG51392 [Rattus norvegicus]
MYPELESYLSLPHSPPSPRHDTWNVHGSSFDEDFCSNGCATSRLAQTPQGAVLNLPCSVS